MVALTKPGWQQKEICWREHQTALQGEQPPAFISHGDARVWSLVEANQMLPPNLDSNRFLISSKLMIRKTSKWHVAAWLMCSTILTGCASAQPTGDSPGKPAASNAKRPKHPSGLSILHEPEDAVVDAGKAASFTVVLEGAQTPVKDLEFTWFRNGEEVKPQPNSPTLELGKAQIADVGLYTCIMQDNKGNNKFQLESQPAGLWVIGSDNQETKDVVNTVTGPFTSGVGSSTYPCPGAWTGFVKFKTTTGSSWWTPPTTMRSVVAVNKTTGYPAKVEIVESTTLNRNCGQDNTSLSWQTARKYQFTTYYGANPPPAGTPITLEITWKP
jgi:hypothetical protein